MSININENILSNVSSIIQNNIGDFFKSSKILNVYYDNEINVSSLKNKYPNIEISNYQVSSQHGKDIEISGDEKFDYIILNEVAEKLIYPNDFISNLKNKLSDDGIIICSVLNLMHISVIKDILEGKFTYSDSGILNKSNLRFFTLFEIRSLFDKEKYNVDQVLAIILDSTKNEEDFINKLCSITNDTLKLSYDAYSYILTASPKKTKTLYDYVLN